MLAWHSWLNHSLRDTTITCKGTKQCSYVCPTYRAYAVWQAYRQGRAHSSSLPITLPAGSLSKKCDGGLFGSVTNIFLLLTPEIVQQPPMMVHTRDKPVHF